jgi:hypothetical protein
VFGHGTGSTQQLFSREAEGKSGEWGNIIRNPHNQTLYVAIQWGLLGCLVLYAMWYFHLQLFRGSSFVSWIGLVIVVQNFISSLLNSHLFDFHEGWIYVLGVGVAGDRAGRQDGVVVGVHGRSAADHSFGERSGRLPRFTRCEMVGEAVEQLAGVGQDHREHCVFRVEIEVEARPRDAGPLADGAHGQVGE